MKGMTLIVKTVTRWVKVFIFLFGVYIAITGHLGPGGGFAGGVILACSYILLTLAYGKEFTEKRLSLHTAAALDCLGALLFLFIALAGLGIGGVFFINFLQNNYPGVDFSLLSAGTIPISNIAIGLKVGASLFTVFLILAVLRIVPAKDGTQKMIQEEEEE
ncbi:MAG TPA: MnhB domain-containing protein [Spirochaetia bacterium]|nr:MnhB domain-containing protein [Spirochaetia bacterium]